MKHRARTGVAPVRFDWRDAESWREASASVEAIYLQRPDVPDAADLAAALIDLNPTSHVVLVEQGAAKLAADNWVRQVENAVAGRARTWTILRPSWFQQDFTDPRFYRDAIRRERTLTMPSGGARIAWVDARDIAIAAVRALRDPEALTASTTPSQGRKA